MKLAEGLIKLPPRLLSQMTEFVLTWYFAHVSATIDKRFRFDEDSLDRAHHLLSAAMAEHHVAVPQAKVRIAREKKVFMKTFELNHESVYDTQLALNVKLKLVFERHRGLATNLGVYRDNTAFIILSPYNLHMTGASLATVASLKASLQKVPELLGFLEHELTHLIQHRFFNHADQLKGNYSQTDEFDDAYGLAPVEFDPLIKSSRATLRRLEQKYKGYPEFNRTEMINAYLSAGPKPRWMHDSDVCQFFEVLKRRAPVRWKKAVKLFMHAY
jgi:hypothetical protein